MTTTSSRDQDSRDVVFIVDPRRSNAQLVDRVVLECNAHPHWIDEFSAVTHVPSSGRFSIALVTLGTSPLSIDIGLEAIRTLKQKGFTVIAYGEGVETWPLGVQCRGLLAGASRVLDSASPVFSQELLRVLTELLEAEAKRLDEEQRVKAAMRTLGIVGESQAMISVFRTILRASKVSDVPILITGETGTGKELVARAIHQLDAKRSSGPFLPFNSSAISPGLAESELFGHRRGAFTGADRERKGLFRAAQGGVLFLDEIGELDSSLQVKLLRVLQDYRVMAVGDDEEVSVNVRIIAATNRDLNEMLRQSKFRADLFHRFNVLSIHIPPLRERRDDIRPLIAHFLEKHQGLRPQGVPSAGPDFLEALTRVELPGNARQLENLVRQVLINKDDESPLNLADLPEEVWLQLSEEGKGRVIRVAGEGSAEIIESNREVKPDDLAFHLARLLESDGWNLSRSLKDCERSLLEVALRAANHNQSQTARLLGITPRSVYNKIRKHRLHP